MFRVREFVSTAAIVQVQFTRIWNRSSLANLHTGSRIDAKHWFHPPFRLFLQSVHKTMPLQSENFLDLNYLI